MTRPGRLVAALAACALVLAGCSGVPTSGPVQRVSAEPGRLNPGVEIAPAPPGRNATPIEVVEGFLHAQASWQPDYSVARAYLTPEASAQWRPEVGVRVYAEGNPVVATERGAALRAPMVGTLDPTGAYRQSHGTLDHDFALVADADGQWRIGRAPSGLVISEYLFSSAFTRVTPHFFAPGRRWLAPDPRYFPRGHQAYEGAASSVLAGATDWLAPAVEPHQTWAAFEAVDVTADGVARVTLRREPTGDPDARQRADLAAQLVWSFKAFEAISAVEVGWSGDTPWTVEPYGRTIPISAFGDLDPTVRQGSRQLFAVSGGRVVRAVENSPGGDGLTVARGVQGATYAAVRSDTLVVAGVTADRQTLVISPFSEGPARVDVTSTGLRRPQFARQGGVWVSNDAGELLVSDAEGRTRSLAVGGMGEGRVETFRLSPDGLRIALVVQRPGGQRVLGLARVTGGEAPVVEAWRDLTVSESAVATVSVLDVGWRAPDSLLVLADDGRTTSVLAVAQDGSTAAPIGPSAMTGLVELAVAPGVPPMVRTAAGEVWRYNSDFRWSAHTRDVTSVFYPG